MKATTPTDVIFIGGRSGAGKSSVAAEASRILARADIRHAVIEGDNLDQAYPEPWRNGVDLAEQNLAAMWSNYRAIGYSREHIERSRIAAARLDTLSSVYTISTDGRDVEGIAHELLDASGWLTTRDR